VKLGTEHDVENRYTFKYSPHGIKEIHIVYITGFYFDEKIAGRDTKNY